MQKQPYEKLLTDALQLYACYANIQNTDTFYTLPITKDSTIEHVEYIKFYKKEHQNTSISRILQLITNEDKYTPPQMLLYLDTFSRFVTLHDYSPSYQSFQKFNIWTCDNTQDELSCLICFAMNAATVFAHLSNLYRAIIDYITKHMKECDARSPYEISCWPFTRGVPSLLLSHKELSLIHI